MILGVITHDSDFLVPPHNECQLTGFVGQSAVLSAYMEHGKLATHGVRRVVRSAPEVAPYGANPSNAELIDAVRHGRARPCVSDKTDTGSMV